MSTKLGFKRLSKATPNALLKRIKEIEKAILSGQYHGKMLKVAKKAHADHSIRYRNALGLKNNRSTQMIFPELLRQMGVTPIADFTKKIKAIKKRKTIVKKSKKSA